MKYINRYFAFLVSKYKMKYIEKHENIEESYLGRELYIYYNKNGMIIFEYINQIDDLQIYRNRKITFVDKEICSEKIDLRDYLYKTYFFKRTMLRDLGKIIEMEAKRSNSAFGIQLKEYD